LHSTVTPAKAGVQPGQDGRESVLAREGNRRSRCRGKFIVSLDPGLRRDDGWV